jgi:CheY-like chemotaxis protein
MSAKRQARSSNSTQADALQTRPCVLLVEDDRSVRRYLEVTLERSGYKVITAEDGLEAMKQALSAEIDVVVTDEIMPQLSGHELARFLRTNGKLAQVPIVLLTGQENRAAAATDENLIDAFLYKPVKAVELRNCLARLVDFVQSESTQD